MWGSKLGAAVLLAAVGVFGAYIPIVLRKCKVERFVCVLNTFAAGAFLGLALFHIMPEAAQTLEKEEVFIYVGKLRTPFNVAFLLIFIGYVVILLCEQVLTVGETSDNVTSPGESAPATPRDVVDEREERRRWGGREGEPRYRPRTDETPMEVVVVSSAAAKYSCELGDNALRLPSATAIAAGGGDTSRRQSGAEVSVVEEGGKERGLTGGFVMDVSAADKTSAQCDSSSIISKKRKDSLGGDTDNGGGCGLGYPCCLMAAAAAREAARNQKNGGGGVVGGHAAAPATTGGEAATPQLDCLEKYNALEEDGLNAQKNTSSSSYEPACCVLKQRQHYPRDSTRASAAGSDTDDIECKDAVDLSEKKAMFDKAAAAARREEKAVVDMMSEDFDTKNEFKGESILNIELIYNTVEGLQHQERKEKEQQQSGCGRMDMRLSIAAAAAAAATQPSLGPGVGACGGSSSSSTTLYHPFGQRDDCSDTSSSYEEKGADGSIAAATRDTMTNDVVACCGGEMGIGRTGGGRRESSSSSFEVATAMVRATALLQEDSKYRVSLPQTGQGESCREGAEETQDDKDMHKWWGRLLLRRRVSRQEEEVEKGKDVQETRKSSRISCGRCHPSRFFYRSLPLSGQVNGGAFFLMAALAIHGLFEGFVVGAESNLISLWIITSVIAAHKWAESLLLMAQFMDRHLSARWSWILMSIFVASSPLGIIIGACLSNENLVAAGVCNALGAGTLLFVAAEVSTKVFTGERKHRLLQLFVYCGGAAMVFGLNLLDIALEAGALAEEEGYGVERENHTFSQRAV